MIILVKNLNQKHTQHRHQAVEHLCQKHTQHRYQPIEHVRINLPVFIYFLIYLFIYLFYNVLIYLFIVLFTVLIICYLHTPYAKLSYPNEHVFLFHFI